METLELASMKCSKKTEYLVDFQFIIKDGVQFPKMILNGETVEITDFDCGEGYGCRYIHVQQEFTVDNDFELELKYDDEIDVDKTTIKLTEE